MQYEFNGFVLDVDAAELRTGGRVVELQPQVFAVLAYLIEYRDRFVTKQELFDVVWGTRFVSESALTTRIKERAKRLATMGRRGASSEVTAAGIGSWPTSARRPPARTHADWNRDRRIPAHAVPRRATGCRSRTRRSAKGRRWCSWAGSPPTSK